MSYNWISTKKVILLFTFWEVAFFAKAHNGTSTLVDPKEAELSREILQFLKYGEEKMEVGKFRNVTLVLGVTGSGKTTLTQFITGNDDGLIAKEIGVDTDEFIITDKNNNVCNKTVDSCTIIPTLYVEKQTNSGFYDCPGFGDTRSVKHDISVTYFIKRVVDSVDAVKLLLTVNYPSVRQGVDRQNFMLLVKNVMSMVKNVAKFKDGIALIVTKVDNQYKVKRGQAVLVPDRTIIGNIAIFLEEAKESINAKVSVNSGDQAFYQNAIKFIDILLEKNGDDYPRIGLFRRPNEGGKVREVPLLQSGKVVMGRILRQNIRYIPKEAEDFGYTLSAESLNHMHALISNINEDLAINFRSMAVRIHEHYRSQERESRNIEELCKNFTYGHQLLLKMKENRNYSTPILLMKEINDLAKAENIEMPGEIMANIAHYDHFLNFLNTISGLTSSPLQWLQGLNDAVENMSTSRNWLDLLVNLQNELLKYDVLIEVRRNQTAADALRDLMDRYVGLGSEGGLSTGLQEFLQQVFKDAFEKEYGKIRSILKVSVAEWKLLRDLLDFRVLSPCIPESSKHILMGQYVKLSDIRGTRCSNKHVINIFALRKVFIDEDFIKIGENIKLVIMAPTWEVVGSPKIILDGKDGQNYYPRKAANGYQTVDSGLHGHDGNGGEKGGPAGIFWGIGQNCINCHQLTITANGGKGGDGQDGGDGGAGRDYYYESTGDRKVSRLLLHNEGVENITRRGQQGGNGGNGGPGGLGGPKGVAQFVLFGDGKKPKTSAIQGLPGRGGAGGSPGRGGQSDSVIKHSHNCTVLNLGWETTKGINLTSADSGSSGANGFSPSGTYSEPEQIPSPYETLASFIEQLKFQISDTTSHQFVQNLGKTYVDDLIKDGRYRSTNEIRDASHQRRSNPRNQGRNLMTTLQPSDIEQVKFEDGPSRCNSGGARARYRSKNVHVWLYLGPEASYEDGDGLNRFSVEKYMEYDTPHDKQISPYTHPETTLLDGQGKWFNLVIRDSDTTHVIFRVSKGLVPPLSPEDVKIKKKEEEEKEMMSNELQRLIPELYAQASKDRGKV